MIPTDIQKANALNSVQRGLVDDFHPHDPERMDSFADVEICAASDLGFSEELAKAKVIGSRALLGRIHDISQSSLRPDDKRARIGALLTIAKLWNPDEFTEKKAIDVRQRSIGTIVHRPFTQMTTEQKRELEAFFGVDSKS